MLSNMYIDNTLQWRHNLCIGVSSHLPPGCLLNHLFRRRSKKTWKLRVIGFCKGNPRVTGICPSQRASSEENASIWLCHYGISWIWDTEIFLYIHLPYLTRNCSWLIFPDLLEYNCKIQIRPTTNARFNLAFSGQKFTHIGISSIIVIRCFVSVYKPASGSRRTYKLISPIMPSLNVR